MNENSIKISVWKEFVDVTVTKGGSILRNKFAMDKLINMYDWLRSLWEEGNVECIIESNGTHHIPVHHILNEDFNITLVSPRKLPA